MRVYGFIPFAIIAFSLIFSLAKPSVFPLQTAEEITPDNLNRLASIAEYPLNFVRASAFDFSPNGELIAINHGTHVSVMRLADLQAISSIYHPLGEPINFPEGDEEAITSMVFLSDWVLATGSSYSDVQREKGSLRFWDVQTGNEIALIEENLSIRYLIASPNGQYIAYIRDNGEFIGRNLENQDIFYEQWHGFRYLGKAMAFSSDNRYFAILDNSFGVRLINLETWAEHVVNQPINPEENYYLDFSPNSDAFMLWGERHINIYGMDNFSLLSQLEFNHGGWIGGLIRETNGNRLIAAGNGEPVNLEVYDSHSGQSLFTLDAHADSIFTLAQHPNYFLIATGSRDGSVKIWNFDMPEPVALFEATLSRIPWDIAFSPDGNYFVATSDTRLHIWRIE